MLWSIKPQKYIFLKMFPQLAITVNLMVLKKRFSSLTSLSHNFNELLIYQIRIYIEHKLEILLFNITDELLQRG